MKQRESGLPFDDIRNLATNLPAMDADARTHTHGQLEKVDTVFSDICLWYSQCSGRSPAIHRPALTLFAGTHAVENRLDANQDSEKLLEMVTEISAGSAFINRLCHQHDVGLKVFDLALQIPVDDISEKAALDEKSCAGTIAFGMEAIAGGADLLCVAALESRPTLSSLAIISFLSGSDIGSLIELRGEASSQERDAVEQALKMVKAHQSNSLEVLRRLGGRETAAICGAILAARSQHIPVLIDGCSALAAAMVLNALEPGSLDHVRFAQRPGNEALSLVVDQINIKTIIDTNLCSNAEEGVLSAAGIVKSACLLIQGRP